MPDVKRSTRCTVCKHPKLKQIERAIVLRPQPLRVIAESYGLSLYAVERHRENHMSPEEKRRIYADARAEQAALDQAASDQIVKADRMDVIGSLGRLSKRCEAILDRAEEEGQDGLALSAVRELRHQIMAAAKIVAEVDATKEQSVIVADHPSWLAVRDILFRVFDRHPAAKADFLDTVRSLGNAARRLAP